jgi:hypothetical protein
VQGDRAGLVAEKVEGDRAAGGAIIVAILIAMIMMVAGGEKDRIAGDPGENDRRAVDPGEAMDREGGEKIVEMTRGIIRGC